MKKSFIKRLVALALVIVSVFAVSSTAFASTASVGGVNVRSGPSTSYSRIGDQIAQGSSFIVRFQVTGGTLNGSKNWYYVTDIDCSCGKSSCNAPFEGYIHSSCISNLSISTSRPNSQTSAFGSTTLNYGTRGVHVYNIQRVLYAKGYLDSLSDCDGIYGGGTTAAVEDFQADYWYLITDNENEDVVDGLVGPKTMYALWQVGQNTLSQYGATY